MEGFARMSVAWGAWLGGAENPCELTHGDQRIDVLDLVVRGLLDGTDPEGPWFWGHIMDRDQRIVEAAELAFALWSGRGLLVPALGDTGLAQVLAWLGEVHGRDVYADNWVLFPSVVATVQRALGVAVPDTSIDVGIDRMSSWYRGDGWYSDGDGHAFDRYTGWAIHWHLLQWAEIEGGRRPKRRDQVRWAAATWMRDMPAFSAADGAIPLFGRSLGYRFATPALLGLAATQASLPIDPGTARGVIDRAIRYHLGHGAIDEATDWFRVGVWGERPDVCERYMSAGAAAWAMRALVPLQLPADDPFWTATDPGPADPLRVGSDPTALSLVLRGPGFLVGRRTSDGGTWVASSLADHPDDIPGHDYRTAYGKWLYDSGFPFTERTADGGPGSDGSVTLVGPDGSVGHRGSVDAGGVGPGWTWSRYRVAMDSESHAISVVSVRVAEAWLRVIGLRPTGPVRATTATLPLGADDAESIVWQSDPRSGRASARAGRRYVAIQALHGFNLRPRHGPHPGIEDRNLVAAHSDQPSLTEPGSSDQQRLLVSLDVVGVSMAGQGIGDAFGGLNGVTVDGLERDHLVARTETGDTIWVSVARRLPRSIEVEGWRVLGPALHVVRIAAGGRCLAGERVSEFEGALRLERPGPIEIRKCMDGGLLVGTEAGLEIDPRWWSRRGSGRAGMVQLLDAERWRDVGEVEDAGILPSRLVRRLQRTTGHAFLWLRMLP